jgi:Tfp pilus assembly protein PilN
VEHRVIRFNYLAPDRMERVAFVLAALREGRLRVPIAAVALSFLLLRVARSVEDWRIAQISAGIEALRARESAIAAARLRVGALSTDVTRLQRIAEYVRSVRRSGVERAEELASIGNSLPLHVWLTAIRDTEGGWAISGGARNVADVGGAMLALERVPRVTSAMLVSAQGSEREHTISYEMRLGRR